jgi:hypothetical protein
MLDEPVLYLQLYPAFSHKPRHTSSYGVIILRVLCSYADSIKRHRSKKVLRSVKCIRYRTILAIERQRIQTDTYHAITQHASERTEQVQLTYKTAIGICVPPHHGEAIRLGLATKQ